MSLDESISVKVPQSIKKRLELKAKSEGMTFSDFLREVFNRELGSQRAEHGQLSSDWLLEQLNEFKTQLAELRSAQVDLLQASSVSHRNYRGDQFRFFLAMVNNPHVLPDQSKQLDESSIQQLFEQIYPEEFN